MKGDGVRDSGTGDRTAWFRICICVCVCVCVCVCLCVCVCVCVCGNGAERRVSGFYLYSGGPGYPWIHLGDWEACRRRK